MAIATLGDESSPLFPLHALLGVALLFVVAGRLLWAFIGSRTARLSSFDFRPSALVAYLRGMLGSAHRPTRRDHTPPTSDLAWDDVVGELRSVRLATVSFFRNLPPDRWTARGIASGNTFSVRALAFLAVGHADHHAAILAERYGARGPAEG